MIIHLNDYLLQFKSNIMTAISPIWFFLCFLGLCSPVLGRRSFDIVFKSINCSTNIEYVSESSCRIDSSQKTPKAYILIQMNNFDSKMNFSFELTAFKSNNDRLKVFSVTNVDSCKFFENKTDKTMLTVLNEVLSSGGPLPKCPISKDYRFDFKGIFVDVEKFPPYVPEAKYLLSMTSLKNKEIVFGFDVIAEVAQKKKGKQFGW